MGVSPLSSEGEHCEGTWRESRLQKCKPVQLSVPVGLVLGGILFFIIIGALRMHSTDRSVAIYCEDQHLSGPRLLNLSVSRYQELDLNAPTSIYHVILRRSLPNRMNVPLVHITPARNESSKGSARMVRYLSFDYSADYTSPVITLGLAAASMILLLEHNLRLRRKPLGRQEKQADTMWAPTR